MAWLQLSVWANGPEHVESLSAQLTALGALAVTLYDAADTPILEPGPNETPLWPDTKLVGLFDATQDTAPLYAAFKDIPVQLEPLEDKDWVRAWQEHFKPICFADKLWICPSWCEPPAPDAINLMLDPGLAFGTGTHPTTALCLTWLAQYMPSNASVLDYGCGSGILAIGAKKLGAGQVMAVDYDPQAIMATKDNMQHNGLAIDAIDVFLPADCPAFKADIVIANIIAGPLIALAPTLMAHLKPGGTLVLSGLLETQAETVMAAYPEISFSVVQQEDWLCLSGQRATDQTN